MSEELQDRVTQLEAEVEVLRAYLQAALGYGPPTRESNEFIAQVTRNLHAASAGAQPGRREALDRATKRMNAMAHVAGYKGPR